MKRESFSQPHDAFSFQHAAPGMNASRVKHLALLTFSLVVTGAVLVGFLAEWWWFADLVVQLRAQYAVAAAVLIGASLAMRSRAALLISLAGFLANAAALLPFALPVSNPAPRASAHQTWTFLSVNLLQGNREPARVVEYVRASGADIVVFQEVTQRWMVELAALHDAYPYQLSLPQKDSSGEAVFSRVAPVKWDVVRVTDRSISRSIFQRDGQRIAIAGVHPDKPDKEWKTVKRREYLEAVAAWVTERTLAHDPVVVLGDFNGTPWSASVRRFASQTAMRNANQGVVFGATWSVWQPHRLLIDQAFFSSEWTLLHREIGPHVGSDHRPLLVRAAL